VYARLVRLKNRSRKKKALLELLKRDLNSSKKCSWLKND
jgi:hypothetical protein